MISGKARYNWFALITLVVVALDQASKAAAAMSIPVHGALDVIPGFLALVHARNPGAAFGLMAGVESWHRPVFLVMVSILAAGFLLWTLVRVPMHHWLMLTALAFFFSGAVGNLIDRALFGEVRDFIDMYIGSYHWPAFNVADAALCVGAGIFCVDLLFKPFGSE
jgi:signal peptidase II